jgi:hypothetical protein
LAIHCGRDPGLDVIAKHAGIRLRVPWYCMLRFAWAAAEGPKTWNVTTRRFGTARSSWAKTGCNVRGRNWITTRVKSVFDGRR